jgi:hypothetical protein
MIVPHEEEQEEEEEEEEQEEEAARSGERKHRTRCNRWKLTFR